MENSKKAFSVKGLACIGEGENGHVYRLDEETIIKVMDKKTVNDALIEREKKNAREAFVLGVPTAISYQIADVDGSPGIIYEKLEGKTIQELVADDPERMEELVAKEARLLKRVHQIHVPEETALSPLEELFLERLRDVSEFMTVSEVEQLQKLIGTLSGRRNYIHGDYHHGNVIVNGKELFLIDMFNSSYGHPMYDLMSHYMLGAQIAKADPKAVEKLYGWKSERVLAAWDCFVEAYFEERSAVERKMLSDMVVFYSWVRQLVYLKRLKFLTNDMRNAIVAQARSEFFPYIDEKIIDYKNEIERMR